MIQEIIFILII